MTNKLGQRSNSSTVGNKTNFKKSTDLHSFLFSFEMKKKLWKLQGISLHTQKYHNLPPPSKKNSINSIWMNFLCDSLQSLFGLFRRKLIQKNATLCVREKIKMGKVELSITVLNKILKLFVCINTILHQTFNPLCGPSIVQRHIYIFRINNTSRCFHIITFEYIIKEFSFCKNSTPPPPLRPHPVPGDIMNWFEQTWIYSIGYLMKFPRKLQF